jgi:two-component system OmpR family sensor kinase
MLIHDEETLSAEQRDVLRKVYEDNERAIEMVNEILKVNHEEATPISVNRIKVNVVELIEKGMHQISRDAVVRNITFTVTNKADEALYVLADPHKLAYVFENLFLNAIKYTPQGGVVSVVVEKTDHQVSVSVIDNGIGIPEEDKPHIFRKFYRASNARVIESDGTGLGLFIAKQIMEKNGGSISFESVENKGSTFLLSFPLDVI